MKVWRRFRLLAASLIDHAAPVLRDSFLTPLNFTPYMQALYLDWDDYTYPRKDTAAAYPAPLIASLAVEFPAKDNHISIYLP